MAETLVKTDGRINNKHYVQDRGVMLGLIFLLLKRTDKFLKTETKDCLLENKDKVDVFYDPAGEKPTLIYGRSCNICPHSKNGAVQPCKVFHKV